MSFADERASARGSDRPHPQGYGIPLEPRPPGDGRHKARFFLAFGFSPERPDALVSALWEHPSYAPITDTWSEAWGMFYDVSGPFVTPDGRNPSVLTAWIHDGLGPFRLVTAYPA